MMFFLSFETEKVFLMFPKKTPIIFTPRDSLLTFFLISNGFEKAVADEMTRRRNDGALKVETTRRCAEVSGSADRRRRLRRERFEQVRRFSSECRRCR